MNNLKIAPLLIVFSEVASARSFTQAGKKLAMSKAAVSQQIKRLESILGQQLLSRHTRGMTLTQAGKTLLQKSALLADQVNQAVDEVSQLREVPSGTFSITLPHSLETDIVYPALQQLCSEFPQIEPKLLVTDQPMDLIQHNLDIALYGGHPKDSSYRAQLLGKVGEIFCAAPEYIRRFGQPSDLQQLSQHKWLPNPWQSSPLPVFHNQNLQSPLKAQVTAFGGSNTMSSNIQLAIHGLGIGLFPEFSIHDALIAGRLVRVLPDYQGQIWPMYMLHSYGHEKPVHVIRFGQLVKHFLEIKCSNISPAF